MKFEIGQKVRVYCEELLMYGRYGRVACRFPESKGKQYIVRTRFGAFAFSENELRKVS